MKHEKSKDLVTTKNFAAFFIYLFSYCDLIWTRQVLCVLTCQGGLAKTAPPSPHKKWWMVGLWVQNLLGGCAKLSIKKKIKGGGGGILGAVNT